MQRFDLMCVCVFYGNYVEEKLSFVQCVNTGFLKNIQINQKIVYCM